MFAFKFLQLSIDELASSHHMRLVDSLMFSLWNETITLNVLLHDVEMWSEIYFF